jgi:hypothetical protein
MRTALVLLHGRSQQLPRPMRRNSERVDAHVANLRRSWLAGLSKGLVLANRPPVAERDVSFPFYGNRLADLVEDRVASGLAAPELELDPAGAPTARDRMILETATWLGFDPAEELRFTDPGLAEEAAKAATSDPAEELDVSSGLRFPVVRAALQFIARKTGTAEFVIEEYLSDVAYYLTDEQIRGDVLHIVQDAITAARQDHDGVVVVAHSLGTVVAYDALRTSDTLRPVWFLVTAGSPLGLPAVWHNLVGSHAGAAGPALPDIDTQAIPRWLNAYDVRDVVALIHPLRDVFRDGRSVIRDVVTHNPTGPHSITDYLSDPDVASAVATAMTV